MVKPLPITLGKAPSELIRGEPSNTPSMMGNGKAHGMVWKIQGLTNSLFRHIMLTIITSVFATESGDADCL
jgi:hypothetical protein